MPKRHFAWLGVQPQYIVTLVLVVLGGLLLHAASQPFGFGDLFWQIRAGEAYWQHQALKLADDFSWTRQGALWFEFEWFIQLLFYALHCWGGLLAIRLFFMLLWLSGAYFLWRALKQWQGGLAAAVIMALFLCLAYWQFLPAPRTVSMWLAIGFALIWQPWRPTLTSVRLWSALGIFTVWCHVHPESFVGWCAIALHAALTHWQRREWPSLRSLRLLLGATLALLLTPHFPALLPALWKWDSACGNIDEVRPLLVSQMLTPAAKLIFIAIGLGWGITWMQVMRRDRRTYWRQPVVFADLIALVMVVLALKHGRYLWVGLVPLLVAWPRLARLPAWNQWLSPAAVLLLVATCLYFKWHPARALDLLQPTYWQQALRRITLPVGAADYLLQNPLPGKMFNHYPWGGYLIYRLYPHYRVFIDGRTFLYDKPGIFADEQAISHGDGRTPELLKKYDFDFLVVAPQFMDAATAQALGWTKVYGDAASAIYRRAPTQPLYLEPKK